MVALLADPRTLMHTICAIGALCHARDHYLDRSMSSVRNDE